MGDAMEFKAVGLTESLKQALQGLKSPIVFGAWLTTTITVLGVGYAVLAPKPSQSQGMNAQGTNARDMNGQRSIVALAKLGYCHTIATDPNPPLNVRSSPIAAPDNIVGNLKNGSKLTVINENQGWLQVSAPIQGWIYEPLTVTTCNPNQKQSTSTANPAIAVSFQSNSPDSNAAVVAPDHVQSGMMMSGDTLVAAAQTKFHEGDLTGAMGTLRQVPTDDLSRPEAESLLKTMPSQWSEASQVYDQAEIALKTERPNTVLALVSKVPDIRYWRSKITPLVKQSIVLRSQLALKSSSVPESYSQDPKVKTKPDKLS